LFDVISLKIASRPGGYTRVIKLGKRAGDNAELGMIELVDYNEVYGNNIESKEAATAKRTRRAGRKKAASTVNEPVTVEASAIEPTVTEEVPPVVTPDAPEAQEEPVK
jgi:large subunit ribosomal protein L17